MKQSTFVRENQCAPIATLDWAESKNPQAFAYHPTFVYIWKRKSRRHVGTLIEN